MHKQGLVLHIWDLSFFLFFQGIKGLWDRGWLMQIPLGRRDICRRG